MVSIEYRSTLYFVMLFVGACVMFAGITTWVAVADMDYRFAFVETQEDVSRDTTVGYYELLSPEQKEMFHGAVDEGKAYTLEERAQVPREVIKYNGTYYVFDNYGYYDWLTLNTGGPALVVLGGLAIMIEAVRRDVKYG